MASDTELAHLLGEVAGTLVADFSLESALGRLTERALDIVPVSGAGVTLIASGVDPLPLAASDDRALHLEDLQTTLHEGPCLAAWESGAPVMVPDLRHDDRFPIFTPRALELGLAGVFTFPVRRGSRCIGALDLYRDSTGPLTDEATAAARILADVAGAYLGSAQARSDDIPATSVGFSLVDPVTGLPTRALLEDRMDQVGGRAVRARTASAVFFLTVGPPDPATWSGGQQATDELLAAAAVRLGGLVRPGDTLARLDDGQFVVVCEDLEDPGHAADLAAQLETAMASPFALAGGRVTMRAHAGVAFLDGRSSAAAVLAQGPKVDGQGADHRGDHRTGGHRTVALRTEGRREQHLANNLAELERDLHGAAARGELVVHYQPIIDASDGGMVGVEALLRWLHPTRGLVSPSTTIPLAEHSSLMVEIGLWVLEHSLAAGRSWQRLSRRGGFEMSVNVTASQLASPGFVATVDEVLRASGTDPGLLTLEVTEGTSVGAIAIGVLTDLKRLGVRLALDDFGTGYSSLSDIARFPVDIIKIDRAFVVGLGVDPVSTTVVRSVIELAHGLGMTVVAEAVETEVQLQELARMGCDAYQGFYFSPPLAAARLDALADRPARPNYSSLLAPSRWEPLAGPPPLDGAA